MKIIVAGGRNYVATDKDIQWLVRCSIKMKMTELVCGMATGADEIGYRICHLWKGHPVKKCYAFWTEYGKKAGYIRNKVMAEYADGCILFPGNDGTKMMKDLCIQYKRPYIEYPSEEIITPS